MSRERRIWLLLGVLVIAALLAIPLRETVSEMILIPVAYLSFQLGLFYHALPQVIWWWIIVAAVTLMLVRSLVPQLGLVRKKAIKLKPRVGPVQELATWLERGKGGTYFKWLVANRLGKLAYQMLLQRESGRPRSVFAPLVGTDWEPTRELQTYLEIGLHGSFSDFPHSGPRLFAPPKTPLDYEVQHAVEFLESQLEEKPG